MRTSEQFQFLYSIDNFSSEADHFYIKNQNWGRELTTGEKERDRMRVRGWLNDAQSVIWKSQSWGENMCLQKGEECRWGPIKIKEKSEKDR
jgi:hypothetical protein